MQRERRLKIITNADDLGFSPEVNSAIFELMDERLVTSATIMANAPAVEEACATAARYPGRSFGVHLNLTQFKPLTGNPELSKLMSAGRGDGPVRTSGNLASLRAAIFEEWRAQVKRVQSFGIAVSHLDSHHHVHTIPALFPVLKAVQQECGVRKVRLSKNLYTRPERPRALKRLKKVLFNALLRKWHKSVTTDVFTDLAGFCENCELIFHRSWCVEIMLHPGGDQSEVESRLLKKAASSDERIRASLVSYHGVGAG